jgi:hypothetical protein
MGRLQAFRRGEQVRRQIGCTTLLLSIALSNGMQSIWNNALQGSATA